MVGRKSLAEKLLEELKGPDVHDRTYLVLYDFRESRAPTRFYENLKRISALTANGSSLIQLSAYRTNSLKAAIAAQGLASSMGAEVQLYEAAETSPEDLRKRLEEAQTAEEKLISLTVDEIDRHGLPALAHAMRSLDKETPLDSDRAPSPWHQRRIKELRGRKRTEAEEAELQGYLKLRKDQDEEPEGSA